MSQFLTKGFISHSFCIPAPTLTEANLPSQKGRVVIITGGYAGVGQELSRILYQHDATVYVAGRNPQKAETSISATKAKFPTSQGRIEFLQLDLADLSTISKSAEAFLAKESRLDVLVNNAGVMFPPVGEKDAQGHELQMGCMVLGHYLFTQKLTPTIVNTAARADVPPHSVRVLWAGSTGLHLFSPRDGVSIIEETGQAQVFASQQTNYGQAKCGNLYLATEFGRLHGKDGVVSVCFNPGNLQTELQRHIGGIAALGTKMMLHPAIFGAYTELWAGWSKDVTVEKNGMYVAPWGRDSTSTLRSDIAAAIKSTAEGGSGVAAKTWQWCERETRAYA